MAQDKVERARRKFACRGVHVRACLDDVPLGRVKELCESADANTDANIAQ